VNLELAKMFVDQLAMIQEKTRGNLTSEEAAVLRNTLSNLQMVYVEVAEKGAPQPSAPSQEQAAPEERSTTTPEPSAPASSTEPESKKKFTKSYGP
jgi:hypothetical protein